MSLLLRHFSETPSPKYTWFSCHSLLSPRSPPHALWRNGIKIAPQLLTTLKGNVINKLLTSAVSEILLFLLLTGKSLPGEAPFAELAPVPPAPVQANPAFSQGEAAGFLMGGRGFAGLGRRVNGKLLTDANRSHKRPRKSWAPRRVIGCAYMSQQRSPGHARLGGTQAALRTWHPGMTRCLFLPGKPLKCGRSN